MNSRRTIRWSEALATGIHTIDQQHYELLSGINDLICTHQAGLSTQALDTLLPLFKTYVLFHFSEEEMLLARTAGGTEFERQHLAQHLEFAQEIERQRLRRGSHADALIAKELGSYLENWLIEHISSADQQLARLVKRAKRMYSTANQ